MPDKAREQFPPCAREALEAKGFFDATPEEVAKSHEEFLKAFAGTGKGNFAKELRALRAMRGDKR